ncbi:MAG: hypothetical protein KF819_28255 [Labilithrix sp.]|nr:hypothetical protein [Labilithrix sp.]
MKRRAAMCALGGLVAIVAASHGCHRHAAPPLGLVVGSTGPVSFPPPEEGWSERLPLPAQTSDVTLKADAQLRVTEPKLDDKGHFETKGQAIRLWFSEPVVAIDEKTDTKKLPALQVTPSVVGRTVWTHGSEVEFRAERPFDPETTYAIALPELTAPNGKKLEGGFRATFKAEPIVEVAGKTIYYIPKPGRARVVTITPNDASKLGGAQEVLVVYDQPIDIGLASRLVSMKSTDANKTPIPVVVRHPERRAFEGQKIDPRLIVLARPRQKLRGGESFTVEAKSQNADDETESRDYGVAEPTTLVEVACGSGSGDCEAKGNVVRGSSSASLRVRFSNPLGLGYDGGRKHVKITPEPKNLYVSGWDELTISASFSPSTTYAIRAEGMRDEYGGAVPPVAITFESLPLSASATMPSGVSLLDEGATRSFPVTTRNVDKAELLLWPLPKGDAAAFAAARKATQAWTTPSGDPVVVAFSPAQKRDETVETSIDLGSKLERGRAYVAQVKVTQTSAGARAPAFPAGSEASRPSLAMIFAAGQNALSAHVHQAGDKAAVQVTRLASGEPVAGARVSIGSASATTDDMGTALLAAPRPSPGEEPILSVTSGDAELMLPLGSAGTIASRALFPDLAGAEDAPPPIESVGMIVTDRGLYRPGSKMFVKGFVRKAEGAGIRPIPGAKVRLRVVDPMNKDVHDEALVTSARGAIDREVAFDKRGHTGRFHVLLELDDGKHTVIADETVRVADFEAPRFKVDVEAVDASPSPTNVKAKVSARYLFGAAMGGARATWVIKKSKVPVKGGALADAGLSFARERDWYEDDDAPASEAQRPVTGEGVLAEDGTMTIDAVTGPLADGPTELLVEADVSDASYRHVAGQMRVVRDPHARHAGLRLSRRFGDGGQPLRVDLGVVDAAGNAVAGAKVSARLERLTWSRSAQRTESGAFVERWRYAGKTEAECSVTSAASPVSCDLPVPHGGSFRVIARVDGRDDAYTSYWAYGSWLSGTSSVAPSQGKRVQVVLDKGRYKNGETAKLLVQSPFAKAIALMTLEQGGIVAHTSKRIEGPSATFDVPISSANAPWVHAAVTLLPVGGGDADYRVGVVRIPASSDDARLEVKVASAKKSYEIRDEAEITVEVKKGGAPVKNADVTLAVVDEGVLRMTAYHPRDPVSALRPGRGLDFLVGDSRASMLRRREKAHVAGGGDSEGEESLDTRKSFVETAAWLPSLVTDGEGRVKAKVKLPDNLTEFRMTAVVVDDAGGGGTSESSFVVSRPLLLEPIMPRFALQGDRFEAAAMVHNDTDAPVAAKVTVAGEIRDVTIPARGRQRISVSMTAERSRKMRFALETSGVVRDKVEIPLRVDVPGIDEHPMVSGVFGDTQVVDLAIPPDAVFEEGAMLSIKTGSALYPELGQRLSYLLDYPHGCVEQTTSSTIPLVAARTILPWTGTTSLDDDELRRRIEAGVTRLATMQTAGGGLAYWPGGSEPNVYGSAYAMRVLVRAKEMGISRPELIEGVSKFLLSRLHDEASPELSMSIAEVLAQAKELPESAADGLYDRREKLDASGLASLAIALSSLPKQDDRVRDVLDRLESAFDEQGASKIPHDARDWHFWGSSDRDRAQAMIALTRLRPSSRVLPTLASRVSKGLDRWSTQSTAWSLLALADFIGTRTPDGGVDVSVKLEGKILDTYAKLGGDNKEVRVPLAQIAGKKITLLLTGDAKTPSAFALEARYKRPLTGAGTKIARRGPSGVSIHRAYSDAAGKRIDLDAVKPGQIVRVAVRVDLPTLDDYRLGYLAVTDRLPAGLEPLDTDLATTGSIADLAKDHPFYEGLSAYGRAASHVDLRDDKVQLYFDRTYGGRAVYASYLTRATTPGTFTLPPAMGELMYEAGSEGYSDAQRVTVKP